MKTLSTIICVAIGLLAMTSAALADPWSFGVISDTQDTIGTGVNSVATNIIAAVNQQMIARHVDLVLQPGDLGDDGSVPSLTSRLAANAPLTAAGIPFYGLRGNHEDNGGGQAYFQANYIPTSSAGVTVNVAPDATSYAITYKSTTIVMLDILTADSASAMDSATTWMNGVLTTDSHQQAFVLQHKNLLGQNHKDNAFGSGNDSNPTQQNNFFRTLATNGVRYDISGHDHMNHRSIVTSPDGNYKVQEIISQSDSTKFYAASSGFSTREASISDQQNKIGYYVYTVDGPKVTGEYWATPIGGNSDIMANPVWTLQDTFGYSLNGKQFTIARGGSYSPVSDSIAAGAGFRGTSMALAGNNVVTATAEGSRAEVEDVNTGWATGTAGMRSDVLTLWGLNNGLGSAATDSYSLTMSYVDGAGTPVIAHKNADGSWTELSSIVNLDGTVTATGLNFAGDFAVVPEPMSLTLLVLGGLGAIARRRRMAA
jgi:hypothetical protein